MAGLEYIHAAACLAIEAHAKQRRKYTDEAYIVHPMRVVNLLREFTDDPWILCAAWLHDVVEDCGVPLSRIRAEFGESVEKYVSDLTHVYTTEAYPTLNRIERKRLEGERIATTCDEAKFIKVADLIDNTESIVEHDPEFARVYLVEKRALLNGPLRLAHDQCATGWRRGHAVLTQRAMRDIEDRLARIGAPHAP